MQAPNLPFLQVLDSAARQKQELHTTEQSAGPGLTAALQRPRRGRAWHKYKPNNMGDLTERTIKKKDSF